MAGLQVFCYKSEMSTCSHLSRHVFSPHCLFLYLNSPHFPLNLAKDLGSAVCSLASKWDLLLILGHYGLAKSDSKIVKNLIQLYLYCANFRFLGHLKNSPILKFTAV